MKKIVFATNNAHKLHEVRAKVEGLLEVLSLQEIGCDVDIPETAETLEGNALIKAQYIKDHFGYDCFADDTGLEIAALNGAPGVYSARYAGEPSNAEHNMSKVLTELDGVQDRQAKFRTVIAYISGQEVHYFEGVVQGEITTERSGATGFGYDPIFRPEGRATTFAEMTLEDKNQISHRGRAMEAFLTFLRAE